MAVEDKKSKPCRGEELEDLICEHINSWMKEMAKWAEHVTEHLNAIIGAGGGSDKIKKPPPPPFD